MTSSPSSRATHTSHHAWRSFRKPLRRGAGQFVHQQVTHDGPGARSRRQSGTRRACWQDKSMHEPVGGRRSFIGTMRSFTPRRREQRALSTNRVLRVLRSHQAFRRPYGPRSRRRGRSLYQPVAHPRRLTIAGASRPYSAKSSSGNTLTPARCYRWSSGRGLAHGDGRGSLYRRRRKHLRRHAGR